MKVVVDSYAWVELFIGSDKGEANEVYSGRRLSGVGS